MQGEASRSPHIILLEPRSIPSTTDLHGRQRRLSEINRLDKQIKILEDELEELHNTDRASTVCRDVLMTVDSRPDAFLPSTIGPENAAWKQWLEKTTESRGCGCCL